MTRVNLCTNPHADVDVSGWGPGNGSPTLSRVTGVSGMPKTTACHTTDSDFIVTPSGAVTAGTDICISAYIINGATTNLVLFIGWSDSTFYTGPTPAVSAGVATRVSVTATVPAGVTSASMTIRLDNFSFTTADVGGVLIEPGVTTPSDYADGDSVGWSWDGTAGLSSSTQSDVATVSAAATLAGAGAVTSTAAATAGSSATLAGQGRVSATPIATADAGAALAGAGLVTVTAVAAVTAVTALSGVGVFLAAATDATFPAVAVAGAGVMMAGGVRLLPAATVLAGAGVLSATTQVDVAASVVLAAAGVLSATAAATAAAAAVLAGSGMLAAAVLSTQSAAAVLAGRGALAAVAALPGVYSLPVRSGMPTVTGAYHAGTATVTGNYHAGTVSAA